MNMKVIFVGGCHLVGKPHGVQYGFVRLLWKRWRRINRDVHFDLMPYAVNWDALLQTCKAALVRSPELLIINLQAGLVLPTWERTIKRWKRAGEITQATQNWFAPTTWKPQGKGRLYWRIKAALIILLGGHCENWHRINAIWEELGQLFYQSTTRVIVMTPTPARKEYFVRGKSHLERVRKMVLANAGNYDVCDVYPELEQMGAEALWIDGQHLSIGGHAIVAETLWRSLNLNAFDAEVEPQEPEHVK